MRGKIILYTCIFFFTRFPFNIIIDSFLGSGLEVPWLMNPWVDWIVPNVDGSAITNLGQMVFGGLDCNHEGSFISGFSSSEGSL